MVGAGLRVWRVLLLASGGLALAGCTSVRETVRSSVPSALITKATPADQCNDLLLDAFPGDDLDITKKSVVDTSPTATIVTIEATRSTVVPSAGLAREIAVECRFDRLVLMDFHWTKPPFH
jgi:hypothetical protein